MLFGRRKPGFFGKGDPKPDEKDSQTDTLVEEIITENVTLESPAEKPDLFAYMESVEDIPDEDIPPEMMAAIENDRAEALEAAKKPTAEKTKGELLADFIRSHTANTELVSYSSLKLDDPDIDAHLEEIKNHTDFGDIMQIKGQKDTYYYSNDIMTDNYAMIAALVLEKDYAHTVAEMTKWNAKTYPSPTPLEYFTRHPYYMTMPQLERVRRELKTNDRYADIGEVITGNNKVYFHADPPMSSRYAKALAEDAEQGEYGYK